MAVEKCMVILDRDGVINYDAPDYIKSPEEWIAIPGSLAAIARLNQAGHPVTVATNQSGLGRGYYTVATLNAMHQKMLNQLRELNGSIQGIYYCPHLPADGCECRKPKPGMLVQIAKDFEIDLSAAIFIGDSTRDLQAAEAVCCKAIYINNENNKNSRYPDIPTFINLAEAVEFILSN